ncbi:hypothetical protein [Stygiolobus caldivivus]|uniref:SWIM-type domain-containing protein n=1 Tax=Stygiolobus caldivivus TaxID=2824673 RepID=A0A8D5U6Q8_9CREN|nr:hypothetical protein [Stygiolobus caldivivus]BCU70571.1 hypothetical protein KN1_18680 [Stygiolobus caldivivus]
MSYFTIKAKEAALVENRIIRVILSDSTFSIYVFLGKNKDYIMSENYCSCPDFYYRVLLRPKKRNIDRLTRPTSRCYHLQALQLALAKDKIRNIVVDFTTLRELIFEIYTMDKSFILRKLVTK